MITYPELFTRCVNILLFLEGGDKVTNSTNDAGGLTKFGISQRAYPDLNIRSLTKERAIEIYYNDYWLPMGVSRILDDDLVLALFCFGVNVGPRTAIKVLQRLLGVGDDGLIGSQTLRAIREFNGNLMEEFIKREKLFYVTLAQKKPQEAVNLVGWLSRIDKTHF